MIGQVGYRWTNLAARRSAPRQAAADSLWWLMLPILTLGLLLRFDSLPQRGLIYWDEGKFALEGIRLLSVIQALPDVHPGALAGKAVGTAKPTHALLIALSYLLLGIHDYAPLLLDGTASIVEVCVLYGLGRELFDARVGLVAASLLAISDYDVVYARSALSESDADLLFLLGVLLWWNGRWREWDGTAGRRTGWGLCLAAGVLMGAAFSTNYRLLVYIATLGLVDAVMWWRRGGRHNVPSAVAWAAGLALVPALWQAAGMAAQTHGVVLFRSETTYRPTTYVGEVLYQLHGGKQAVLRFDPLLYPQWYVVRQGWPVLLLLLAGLAMAAIKRSPAGMICAALVLVPYAIYAFAPFIVPRNLDAALPFAALLSAGALAALTDMIRRRWIAHAALAVSAILLTLAGARQAWPLTEVRSGFARAADYIQQHGGSGAFVVNEVMVFYLRDPGRGCDAPTLPVEPASLGQDDGLAGDYAVIDRYSSAAARFLSARARLAARYPTLGPASLSEDLIASENGLPPSTRRPERVDVYALDSLHPGRGVVAVPLVCTLDHLG
ncbi:MAG: glycosyltransferase family 39 protein [Chloroflexi bacterium]|nr:glycosyltransferase family 39 protein [Chloroflexota bacterium]